MKQTVNERIKLLITQLNVSQTDFSKVADVHNVSLSRIVNGDSDPSPKTISKISTAYNVNKGWLLTGKGEMFMPEAEKPESDTPWKDEAYAFVKDQLKKKDEQIAQLMALLSKLNFLQALNNAGFSEENLLGAAA